MSMFSLMGYPNSIQQGAQAGANNMHDVGLPRTGEPQSANAMNPGQQMGTSPTQNLFEQYMKTLFNRKYSPPMMQGSPLQNYGGYFGFSSPQMPAVRGLPQSPMFPGFQQMGTPNMQNPYDPMGTVGAGM